MNGQALERRYRWWLRMYPQPYRRQREDELLGTLMDAARPGQRRPAVREVWPLFLSALRVRAGTPTRRTPSDIWLSTLRLSTLLLLADAGAQAAAYAGRVVFSELLMGRGLTLTSDLGYVIELAMCALALLMVAHRRYLAGVLAAGAAFATGQWANSWMRWEGRLVEGDYWQLPLAMVLLLPLLWRQPAGSARPLLWLLAVPAALVLLPTKFDASLHIQPYALLAVAVAGLVWTAIDPRAPLAVGALLLGQILSLLGFYLPIWTNGRAETRGMLVSYAAVAAILIIAGTLAAHRQARL